MVHAPFAMHVGLYLKILLHKICSYVYFIRKMYEIIYMNFYVKPKKSNILVTTPVSSWGLTHCDEPFMVTQVTNLLVTGLVFSKIFFKIFQNILFSKYISKYIFNIFKIYYIFKNKGSFRLVSWHDTTQPGYMRHNPFFHSTYNQMHHWRLCTR